MLSYGSLSQCEKMVKRFLTYRYATPYSFFARNKYPLWGIFGGGGGGFCIVNTNDYLMIWRCLDDSHGVVEIQDYFSFALFIL